MADVSARIVVVLESPQVQHQLVHHLVAEGHDVAAAHSAASLRELMARSPVDLVVLGLPLPDEDGLVLTRHLRERTAAGIILLKLGATAADRAIGLEVGADDYLSRPWHWHEARARVNSVLRRLRERPSGSLAPRMATFAGWRLDPVRRDLISAQGEVVPLAASEFDLLIALLSEPQRVVPRERLFQAMVGRGWQPDDRAVDQRISRLRQKFGEPAGCPRLIKTIRSRGYILAAAVDWE